jgi:hypothetical protein
VEWQVVTHRKTWWRPARPPPPLPPGHRPVPADLVGRCFKCKSPAAYAVMLKDIRLGLVIVPVRHTQSPHLPPVVRKCLLSSTLGKGTSRWLLLRGSCDRWFEVWPLHIRHPSWPVAILHPRRIPATARPSIAARTSRCWCCRILQTSTPLRPIFSRVWILYRNGTPADIWPRACMSVAVRYGRGS